MWSKLDIVFKKFLGKRVTSEIKRHYEEFSDSSFEIDASDVRLQTLPFNNPSQAVTDSKALQYTQFILTEDNTVGNYQCFFAIQSSVRLTNWISDKHGSLYKVHLYDNNSVEIFPTDDLDWIFDYPTGNLIMSGNANSFAKPFKISGYRYVGTKLSDLSSFISIQKFSSTVNVVANVDLNVNHGLNTSNVICQVYSSTGEQLLSTLNIIDNNNITIRSDVNISNLKVVIIG